MWSVTRLSAGCLRIISSRCIAIGDFPRTPCGGTHVEHIGELREIRAMIFPETLKDPEFLAEAEKTRMTLNPIPGATLHNMIVEASPCPRPSKKSSSRSSRRKVSGKAGRHFGIRSGLVIIKQLVGPGPLLPSSGPGRRMLMPIGSVCSRATQVVRHPCPSQIFISAYSKINTARKTFSGSPDTLDVPSNPFHRQTMRMS
jgi:hypothetical protein